MLLLLLLLLKDAVSVARSDRAVYCYGVIYRP